MLSSAGRPCKIVEMSTSKTGKHGHAKVHLVAIDVSALPYYVAHIKCSLFLYQIFTGKKLVCRQECDRLKFSSPSFP